MRAITFRLPRALVERVQALCHGERQPVSRFVTKALEDAAMRHEDLAPLRSRRGGR
jgi:predicted transcriptional regulator